MSITIDIQQKFKKELSAAAAQVGLPLSEYTPGML
jgi:hypothetical protein